MNPDNEIQTISQSATVLADTAQFAIFILSAEPHLVSLLITTFVNNDLLIELAFSIHFRQFRCIRTNLGQENRLFDLLDGSQEAKLNHVYSDDLYSTAFARSASVTMVKLSSATVMAISFILSQAILYVLLAAMVFIVPESNTEQLGSVVKIATAMLFKIGPISAVLASTGAGKHKRCGRLRTRTRASSRCCRRAELRCAMFNYYDQMELLTNLYHPDNCTIELNKIPMTTQTVERYRGVVSDFHPFDRL